MTTDLFALTKKYGATTALDTVSLSIGDGEFLAVLGPSGCGKTTMLRLLAGFLTPTSGEIKINGRQVATPRFVLPPERRHLGMVFQSFALWPHMDVADHVRFPLRYQRRLPAHIRSAPEQRVREILELTGLSSLGNRRPHELSGGQRQRVALARAIAADPSLLLMDEPLSALDAALREDMRREIQDLHQRTRASIVYVTHDQSEALAMADRVAVMRDGRVEQIGSPQELHRQPASAFVAQFLGKATLVPGSWEGGYFYPDAGSGHVRWDGKSVAPALRADGVFPVRPECLEITQHDGVMPLQGTVLNALFQGRDTMYVIDVQGTEWRAYAPPGAGPGDTVGITLREHAVEPLIV